MISYMILQVLDIEGLDIHMIWTMISCMYDIIVCDLYDIIVHSIWNFQWHHLWYNTPAIYDIKKSEHKSHNVGYAAIQELQQYKRCSNTRAAANILGRPTSPLSRNRCMESTMDSNQENDGVRCGAFRTAQKAIGAVMRGKEESFPL